jgi:CHC2-type zinc finger protein/Toprim domain-containing protein
MSSDRKGPISDQFIEDLKTRADLVELVAEHVQLKKAGREFKGRCPFHDDHTPSFTVNPDKQVFNCFGCQAAGGVIDFVMKIDGKSFPEAVEALADRMGASVEREGFSAGRRPLSKWLHARPQVKADEDGEEPRPMPDSWLARLRECQARLEESSEYLASRRIPIELARSLGAGVAEWDGAKRLVLPHADPTGRIVSLYGRRIDGGNTFKHTHLSRPKGMLNATAVSNAELWICEGAFDLLALMAYGIHNAVAVFGVAGIRWGWLRQVRRIVLGFDCDEAGRKAIQNSAKQCLLRGVEVLQITPDELGGEKDIAKAWELGKLSLRVAATPAHSPPVQRLLDLLATLTRESPPQVDPAQWSEFKARCSRFAFDHGQVLTNWTDRELFALPCPDTGETGGALWCISGEIAEVTGDLIRCADGHTIYREEVRSDPWLSHSLPWVEC